MQQLEKKKKKDKVLAKKVEDTPSPSVLQPSFDDDPTVKQASFREDAQMSIDDRTGNVDNNPEVATSQSQAVVQQEEGDQQAKVPEQEVDLEAEAEAEAEIEEEEEEEEQEMPEAETQELQEIQDMLQQQKVEMRDSKEEDIGAGDISSIIMEPLDEEE